MRFLLALLLALIIFPAQGAHGDDFVSLCFHDVTSASNHANSLTLSTDKFVALLTWLREHDYQPVSVDDLLAARAGTRSLPKKAVLLTFDDGYRSFYSQVYPLLKAFDYPAVLALVGKWVEDEAGSMVNYGGRSVPREYFLSWEQIREMAASGLVEIASHSYDLHREVLANPQGNGQPALTARAFDPQKQSYESDGDHLRRLKRDLQANSDLINDRLGSRPRVMVWPFGKYHQPAMDFVSAAGMSVACGLEEGISSTGDLLQVNRVLVEGGLKLADIIWRIEHPAAKDPRRVMHVDLDYIYDPDPQQTEKNLGSLLDRVQALQISTVFLQAFADPDGDGVADAVYFPNALLPVRADLFNRVAWQLKTRCGVEVYAWMPVLAFDPGREDLLVRAWRQPAKSIVDPTAYRRLSPFSGEARELVKGIYADLARHADFDGLLFHDDAFLSDFEDAHPAALEWLRSKGLPDSVSLLRQNQKLLQQWTELKTTHLLDFTTELAETVRIWRPTIKTARNLFARPVLDSASAEWFAQDLPSFLQTYNYVAVMAMPYMEQADDPDQWLRRLVEKVAEHPQGLQRTIFELQAVDWRKNNEPVPTETLVGQMRLLQRLGAVNFGYYPDDFAIDHPKRQLLHRGISLSTFPYGVR